MSQLILDDSDYKEQSPFPAAHKIGKIFRAGKPLEINEISRIRAQPASAAAKNLHVKTATTVTCGGRLWQAIDKASILSAETVKRRVM